MPRKIVECVPNFSEGRNTETIDAIAASIRATPGCNLLDVDPGKSTNRTVFTFVGTPDAVVDGAVNAARVASKLIDMSNHKGEHPRFGAMDVCPFIPVAGVTMEECVQCAKKCGKRMGTELNLPVYMYEYAAKEDYRRLLPDIRQGEYEGIADRIKQPKWAPDFGPAEFNPKWGVTAVGARKFLIAYNINVLGTKNQAHRIALNIREQGRGPNEPGTLKAVKGIGWYVDEYGMAQVSVNIVDINITPMHIVYEECVKEAQKLKLAVVGSEVVGLVPLSSMLEAADYYIKKENLFLLEESEKVRLAIERLGLSSVQVFDPKKKIVEYMCPEDPLPLANLTLERFILELGSRSSAPGGGSASAAIAGMGAALGAMVGWMTYGYRAVEKLDPVMRELIPPLDHVMKKLVSLIDADTFAFKDFMDAQRLPKGTMNEIMAREEAMQSALQNAVNIPLSVMRLSDECWEPMLRMAEYGNINSVSDLQVGAKALNTGIWGANKNVVINLNSITSDSFVELSRKEAESLLSRADTFLESILKKCDERKPASEKEPHAP